MDGWAPAWHAGLESKLKLHKIDNPFAQSKDKPKAFKPTLALELK